MKASEVLEIVQDYIKTHGPDAEVITSIDPEGNGYAPIYSYGVGFLKDGEYTDKDGLHYLLMLDDEVEITDKVLAEEETIPVLCFWPG